MFDIKFKVVFVILFLDYEGLVFDLLLGLNIKLNVECCLFFIGGRGEVVCSINIFLNI